MALTYEKVSGSYIPDDIAICILSKLPVKSIKRFTCVRKPWSLLFKNVTFLTMFRNNLVSKSHSLYDDDDDDVCLIFNRFLVPSMLYMLLGERFANKVKLDPLPPYDHLPSGDFLLHILGSAINGIICFFNCFDHRNVVLWNPTIKEIKAVPPNLTNASILHAFGYDHVRDDFNVIRRSYCDLSDDESLEDVFMPPDFWEIYSLRSNSWRKLNTNISIPYFSPLGSEVYLNGVCHWLANTKDQTFVVSFNLCNDVFSTTPIDGYDVFSVRLVVLNESLAIITKYDNATSFNISILGEIGVKESWTRLFDIGPLSSVEHFIAAGKKENIFFNKKDGKIACFDLTTRMTEEIDVKGEGHSRCC